jgi:hypothetical protein
MSDWVANSEAVAKSLKKSLITPNMFYLCKLVGVLRATGITKAEGDGVTTTRGVASAVCC